MVDAACGFDRANYKPVPEKIPDNQIKLVCPVCQKFCLIPRGRMDDVPSILSWPCPDHQEKHPKKKRVVRGERKKNV